MNKDTENEFSLPFDEAAYRHISKLKEEDPKYNTLGDVVSDSLRIQGALRSKRNKDSTRSLVRNRRTREIRILDFPKDKAAASSRTRSGERGGGCNRCNERVQRQQPPGRQPAGLGQGFLEASEHNSRRYRDKATRSIAGWFILFSLLSLRVSTLW